ncbi:MAG TPA: hypothetical protein VHP54_01965 [Caproiciproducens sp.]|nr:hypothetical protein [Caproiciproducens sp.]
MYNRKWEVIMMLYRIYSQAGGTRIFTEPRSRSRLPYCTAKEMRTRYPDGNFIIIGEIGGFVRPSTEGDRLLTGEEKTLPILPRGSLKKPFEWITGYIAVGEHTYIAAIGNLISAFLRS